MEEKLRFYPQQKKDLEILLSQINRENLTLVEIGSYMGESMAIFAQSNKFSKIFCVDPWTNGYDDEDASSFDCEDAEKHFDERKNNYNFVEKIKNRSDIAVLDFEDESIDIVYIDGNHKPEEVKNDILNWYPKIKKDGIISGHDWFFKNGIIQNIIIETIGHPDFLCGHPAHGTEGDGSWLKYKSNIKL
jgi:hypothetical protein